VKWKVGAEVKEVKRKCKIINETTEKVVKRRMVYTDKKENQFFLIYKEIQSGAVAKSYMRKYFGSLGPHGSME
jgi:hypothetical protein